MNKKYKVIIDTDIGDDIDDAFALLLAMQLGLDIIGITTVFKNTYQRARMTKKLLSDFGRGYENVPVFAGCATPIAEKPCEYPDLCQYTDDIEDDKFTPDSCREDDAVGFITESCKKYGDELIVIALGPFTNIARACLAEPGIFDGIGKFIIMGGAFYKQYADWNVMCDVEAAKIMFDSVRNVNALGADVTHQLRLDESDDKRIIDYSGSPAGEYVSRLYSLWKLSHGNKIGILHDPLAVYYALNPEVCETEKAHIEVIDSGYCRGLTLNVNAYGKAKMNGAYTECAAKLHTVAKTVNRKLMIKEFMRCFD